METLRLFTDTQLKMEVSLSCYPRPPVVRIQEEETRRLNNTQFQVMTS